jgi:threonine synthase
MIGNPVSMPRVIQLEKLYNRLAGDQRVFFVQVTEQEIMDWQLKANRNGHIACTHGGECLAGLHLAINRQLVSPQEIAVVDSTAHALKFAGFQDLYFSGKMPEEFNVVPDPCLVNAPIYMHPEGLDEIPAPGKPLKGEAFNRFVQTVTRDIANNLNLTKKSPQ